MTDETEKMWANVLELNFRPVKNEANRRKKKKRKKKKNWSKFWQGAIIPFAGLSLNFEEAGIPKNVPSQYCCPFSFSFY